MKFRFVQVLDDPVAAMEMEWFANDQRLRERAVAPEVIEASLAVLHDSSSLEEFYSKYIKDEKGRVRQLSDCAARGRQILDQEEKRFVDFLQKILSALESGKVPVRTDGDRHQAVIDLVEGWVIDFRQRGVTSTDLRDRLLITTYVYSCYIFHRALRYLERRTGKIDLNDFEDAVLCLHLRMDSSFIVVTIDKGLRDAIRETMELLTRFNDLTLQPILSVADLSAISGGD